jgi:hypothetical protein
MVALSASHMPSELRLQTANSRAFRLELSLFRNTPSRATRDRRFMANDPNDQALPVSKCAVRPLKFSSRHGIRQ